MSIWKASIFLSERKRKRKWWRKYQQFQRWFIEANFQTAFLFFLLWNCAFPCIFSNVNYVAKYFFNTKLKDLEFCLITLVLLTRIKSIYLFFPKILYTISSYASQCFHHKIGINQPILLKFSGYILHENYLMWII